MSCASPLPASSPASRLLLGGCTDPHPDHHHNASPSHPSFSFSFSTPKRPAASCSSSYPSKKPFCCCTDQLPCHCSPLSSSSSSGSKLHIVLTEQSPSSSPSLNNNLNRASKHGRPSTSPLSERLAFADLRSNSHGTTLPNKQDRHLAFSIGSSPSIRSLKENRGQDDRGAAEGGLPSSPSPLKRKRPAKLTIPESARLASYSHMQRFGLQHEEQEISSQENSLFAVSSKKGRKDLMEDTHKALLNFQGSSSQAFFGVFDGHGGQKAAEFAAENLGKHIATAMEELSKDEPDSLEKAVQTGYLNTDSDFLSQCVGSGACAVSALICNRQLVVANAGDCKAVLCRNGKAEALTTLHHASNEDERRRVESLGGYVDCFNGVWRVQGTLAVTRSFGDMHFKQWVSAEPEVRSIEITEDCEFLILASDGLWDKVSDQEAVDGARPFVTSRALKGELNDVPLLRPNKAQKCHCTSTPGSKNDDGESKEISGKVRACQKLVSMASDRGTLDDITVMIVILQGFSKA